MAGRHCSRNRTLREHIFKYKHEREQTGSRTSPNTLKVPPPVVCCLQQGFITYPYPKTGSQTGNQVFKYWNP